MGGDQYGHANGRPSNGPLNSGVQANVASGPEHRHRLAHHNNTSPTRQVKQRFNIQLSAARPGFSAAPSKTPASRFGNCPESSYSLQLKSSSVMPACMRHSTGNTECPRGSRMLVSDAYSKQGKSQSAFCDLRYPWHGANKRRGRHLPPAPHVGLDYAIRGCLRVTRNPICISCQAHRKLYSRSYPRLR